MTLAPGLEGFNKQSWRITPVTLKAILKTVKKILDDLAISYWLAYGTCLGAARDNNFISWDRDIDLGSTMAIDKEERAKIAEPFANAGFIALWDMNPIADCWGSLTISTLYEINVKVEMHSMNEHSVDFNVQLMGPSLNFYKASGDYIEMVPPGRKFPTRLFANLKEISFLGDKFYVPNPPEEYLRLLYGRDWRMPKETGWENDWRINP